MSDFMYGPLLPSSPLPMPLPGPGPIPWPWPKPPPPLPGPEIPLPDWPIGPSEPVPVPSEPVPVPSEPVPVPVTPPGGAPGGAPAGPPANAGLKEFLMWLAALAVLWLILTVLDDTGNTRAAYSLAALILGGALIFMGPKAIQNAQHLFD